jgi:hypothetical protein
MKRIITFLIILIIVISCEPIEVQVQDSFDFQIKSEYLVVNKIETEIPTILNIIPERIVEDTNYSFSYKIFEGDGFFKLGNTILVPEQEYEIEDLQLDLKYTGEIDGEHKITTTLTDSKGLSKNHLVAYQIEGKTDFDFIVSFDKDENYINEYTDFTLRLDKKGDDELTYKAYFQNIEGELKVTDIQEVIKQNELFNISEGINIGKFKSIEVQDKEIEFVIEASNGIRKSKTISFNSLQTNFEVIITPTPFRGHFSESIQFNILIEQPDDLTQEISYSMYFTSMDLGNLYLKINNFEEEIITTPGYEVDLGTNPYMNGSLIELGIGSARTGTMTFHFTDSNGAEYKTSVNVEFYDN